MRRLWASPLNLLIYPGKHKPRSQQKLIGSHAPSWHINYFRVYCFTCCFYLVLISSKTTFFYFSLYFILAQNWSLNYSRPGTVCRIDNLQSMCYPDYFTFYFYDGTKFGVLLKRRIITVGHSNCLQSYP